MIHDGMGIFLEPDQRQELIARHRGERDGRIRDRIKAVLLYDVGWTPPQIAEALFLSDEAVRKHLKDFQNAQKLKPANGGSTARLNAEQTQKLLAHLDAHTYTDTKDILDYVRRTFGVTYARSGLTEWLHRNGFSFHKPATVPAKADKAKQAAFVEHYENLKKTLPPEDVILFLDATHPCHALRPTHGWIRRGVRKELPQNGSQKRVNILGALDLATMTLVTKRYETINGAALVDFLQHTKTQFPKGTLHVLCDQGPYNTGAEVQEFLRKTPTIKQHLLPTYSPNLNTIERCWKIMHEHVTNNRYYRTFREFADAIDHFFTVTFPAKARTWIDRLTDNFRPLHSPLQTNS